MTEPSPAPAPAPSPAPSPSPAPAPAPAPAPSDAAFSWDKAGLDTDTLGWVQTKGFKDPASTVHAYRNLEKLIGAGPDRLIQLPKDDTPEAWNAVYDKLGRPKDASEYKLPVPEGQSGDFAKVASGWMHKHGLNPRQAQGLATEWNDFIKTQQTTQRSQQVEQDAAQGVALKQEWGQAYDQNVNLAKRAIGEVLKGSDGKPLLDAAALDKLDGALGHATVMKLLHTIGTKLGVDDKPIGMDQQGGGSFGPMTPAAAAYRKQELMKDSAWVKAWNDGDSAKQREMLHLNKILAGG